MSARPLLEVDDLTVAYRRGEGWSRVVEGVSFSIAEGEVLGLVGESGCGKSTVALQLLGYRHPALRIERGSVSLRAQALTGLKRSELDNVRGVKVSFVPQNPTTALNPGIRVGAQVAEMLAAHGLSEADLGERFALVGLPGDAAFRRRFPHQLSGGQQQRVCIAMALACHPDVVVLDEPTTGLDVTTQAQIVALLADLRQRLRMSMLYVTHDLALLSQIADRVGVMYAGRLVEIASAEALFRAPRHPYTQGLIASIPQAADVERVGGRPLRGFLRREELPPGCPFQPRCDHARPPCAEQVQPLLDAGEDRAVACWRWSEISVGAAPEPAPSPSLSLAAAAPLIEVDDLSISYGRAPPVVRNVSFTLAEGETLALVGESGSGKSTIARAVSGLLPPSAGGISLRGTPLAPLAHERSREERRLIQLIFQNPDASINPRARIFGSLRRPVAYFFPDAVADSRALIADALTSVRLDTGYQSRFPDELSGGERQRVAIARALLARPALLLCDEVLSALDVSVQANVLTLLRRLKEESRIAMLFISHDLAVVRLVADQIAVLFQGEIMEIGATQDVMAPPFHPYTHALLQAAPKPLQRRAPVSGGPAAAPAAGPARGCVYAARCAWKIGAICDETRPPLRMGDRGAGIRCHHSPEALAERAERHEGADG
ncbi:ABC transporter ATP-binding protein [Pikeienuella piscinae]|uniref:ABC transporter ATP-binding protein n=1 Tax=Pikeienuella piscinae TaxID=2748098 RepID=A0A7L5BTY9_9RHOB|nr:ABC transporter ATP-binding protein [Pikeienuella piscinae]QIE54621.1 ABC transporter ATP-binding protein [Pikeienuella piscinae]